MRASIKVQGCYNFITRRLQSNKTNSLGPLMDYTGLTLLY